MTFPDGQAASWMVDPNLVVLAIKGLIRAVLWLCGIIGSCGIFAGILIAYIDRQRMKRWDKMEASLETIADAITVDKLNTEHRLTEVESKLGTHETYITDIRKLCGDRRC